jgi:hypothetical protein
MNPSSAFRRRVIAATNRDLRQEIKMALPWRPITACRCFQSASAAARMGEDKMLLPLHFSPSTPSVKLAPFTLNDGAPRYGAIPLPAMCAS